jgi:hypothetical protein
MAFGETTVVRLGCRNGAKEYGVYAAGRWFANSFGTPLIHRGPRREVDAFLAQLQTDPRAALEHRNVV